MFAAKSIMAKELITVSEDTPIYAAVRLLVECDISGLPVVSEGMQLVGVVSEVDLLALLYKSTMQNATVGEVMTREVISFDVEDDLIDVCEAMIQKKIRRVPILKEGKLVGIISRCDILKFILKLRHEN